MAVLKFSHGVSLGTVQSAAKMNRSGVCASTSGRHIRPTRTSPNTTRKLCAVSHLREAGRVLALHSPGSNSFDQRTLHEEVEH